MNRRTLWSKSSLLLIAALLAGPAAAARAAEDAPLERAKKLIDANKKMISYFAVPTLKYMGAGLNSERKLDDGYELTYTFEVKGRILRNINTFQVAFLFDRRGNFQSLSVLRDTLSRFWDPFGSAVSEKELRKQRQLLEAHPEVKDNRKLLSFVRDANAKQLCQLYLRLEQGQKLAVK